MKFGKVGVLLGGSSKEREISLLSGRNVLKALQQNNIDAYVFDPCKYNLTVLAAQNFDRIFIALHGCLGEDGAMQGALEQLRIPYTGSGVMASAIAMNKIITKRIWLACNLPTPNFLVLDTTSITALCAEKFSKICDILSLPLIFKTPCQGSTIGIIKIKNYHEIPRGLSLCAAYNTEILAEEFVIGRELTVPVLGYKNNAYALPIVEIRAQHGEYGYYQKYFDDTTKYLCPAPLDSSLTKYIQALAVESYNSLNCRGWARIDFILRACDNKPFLLEINTSPGMTNHSLVPISAKEIGMHYIDLCCEILKTATLDT